MATFARIENGTVAELLASEAAPEALFHPSLRWVAVAAPGVAVGWRHTPDGFAPPPAEAAPPPPSLAELHARISDLAAQVARLAG
jgi:hypothetical protein